MMEIVKDNMTRAQGNQKRICDKSTREREQKVGDQVLALLPKEENKNGLAHTRCSVRLAPLIMK